MHSWQTWIVVHLMSFWQAQNVRFYVCQDFCLTLAEAFDVKVIDHNFQAEDLFFYIPLDHNIA